MNDEDTTAATWLAVSLAMVASCLAVAVFWLACVLGPSTYPGLDVDDPCAYCGERSAEEGSEFCDGCRDRLERPFVVATSPSWAQGGER